ncbi:MAG: hypothetical protein IJJ91_12125 [Synergistaceae bacterium]|nr:hypothetical protein [Synergistaceae bacterium]
MISSIWEADLRYEEWREMFAEVFAEARAESWAEGWILGWIEGWLAGNYSRQLKIARKMLAMGYDEDIIHTITELPIDDIRKLDSLPA